MGGLDLGWLLCRCGCFRLVLRSVLFRRTQTAGKLTGRIALFLFLGACPVWRAWVELELDPIMSAPTACPSMFTTKQSPYLRPNKSGIPRRRGIPKVRG